ncbi:MAG: molybdenum cofactor biosynthesis protein B, partial [Candidatus Bathyarchaeia archaeon]
EAGDAIEHLVKESRQLVTRRELIADDPQMIRDSLTSALQSDVDVVVTTGGTGFTSSDITVETARNILDKEMPGFGEIFRKLTYDEIGSPAIMTRALAGVAGRKPVFCLPGSPHAVKLAVEKLILPEAGHLVKLLQE